MATCSVLGQALGTAIACAVHEDVPIERIKIHELQQTLMDDDCYIPWHKRKVSALSLSADCSSEIVRNGMDRGDDNLWHGNTGDTIEYTFSRPTEVKKIRLVFDSNLNKDYHNMPCNFPLNEKKFILPHTLIKEYRIVGYDENGEVGAMAVTDNHHRFVVHDVAWRVTKIKFIPISTHSDKQFRIFDFEVM